MPEGWPPAESHLSEGMRIARMRHRPSRHRDELDLPPKDSLGHFMSLPDFPLNLEGFAG
jgi:hypothetical protein